MAITDLYRDFNIEVASEDHRHFRKGWVNIKCPNCTGNPGFHLGFNVGKKYFSCYRCGGHTTSYILSKVLKVSFDRAKELAKQYKIYSGKNDIAAVEKWQDVGIEPFKFPSNIIELNKKFNRYLSDRGFNPDQLVKDYNIKATGPLSKLYIKSKGSVISFKHRLVTPIYWKGRIVSFQGRDITRKQKHKYITCPKEREIIHHKHIMFCKNGELPKIVGVWVEGKFDVFRIGDLAMASFGIKHTPEQIRLVATHLKKVFIWFDPDPQAIKQATKIAYELKYRGVETSIIQTDKDPADTPQEEVDYIVKQIRLK